MISVLGLTLVYAVCFVAIKEGLAFAPPLLFAGLRAIIAGAALLALAAAQRKRALEWKLMPQASSLEARAR